MSIIIGADCVPTKSNMSFFCSGDMDQVVDKDIIEILGRAEYRIFNLETPLCNSEDPIKKCGPNLMAPCACVNGYKSLGIDLLTLANNHILDQGEQGLKATIDVLSNNKIEYVGVGKDEKQASNPHYFMHRRMKVGVYACAEHEFSNASVDKAGANSFDPLYSLDQIEEIKRLSEYVIVLYHGGKEHYRYPSPILQKTCRRIIEKGADLVVCQHSHCIGCCEHYQNGTIIYGQGNFLFDYCDDECWQTGLLICINNDYTISYIPIVKNNEKVRLAKPEEGQIILGEFQKRSEEICKKGFVYSQYREYAERNKEFYLNSLLGKKSIMYRIFNKVSRGRWGKYKIEKAFTEDVRIRLINNVNCEAHRELFLSGIQI